MNLSHSAVLLTVADVYGVNSKLNEKIYKTKVNFYSILESGEEQRGCEDGWRRVGDECLRFFSGIENNTPAQAEGTCAENGASSIIMRSWAKTQAIMEIFPEQVQRLNLVIKNKFDYTRP